AGQGTVALEILAAMPDVATIVVPVGGGGLLGGTGSLVRRVAPHVRLLGAQSERTRAMSESLRAGHLTEVPIEPTLADGLAGQIDEEAFDIGLHALDAMATVSEEAIGRAIRHLATAHGARVEGAGAVGVAALMERAFAEPPRLPLVVIVSGGNIDEGRWKAVVA
ncbi:MAG TPA: pyridoxal-phosphate dependent enzyme, partial [Gemmatimonadaceae bacterium]|nr:pyridoxal-phosphate dependent enzyme [Gemmatimonadaceae bacterium]